MVQATRASSSNNRDCVVLDVSFLCVPSNRYLCRSFSLLRGRTLMDRAAIAGCWTMGSIIEGERAMAVKHDGVDCLIGSACSRNTIEDIISVSRNKRLNELAICIFEYKL